jgi:suppressor for copper-sensitivity B
LRAILRVFRVLRVLRALAAALLLTPALAAQIARPQKARLALEAVGVADGEARLVARVAVDEGWHVQAHVPTYDYLIPTVLRLDLPPGAGTPEIEYPAPRRYKFGFAEDELDVYDGELALPVRFRLPPGARGPFEITATLRYQACDDKLCLPPVETRASLLLALDGSTVASSSSFLDEETGRLPTKGDGDREGAATPRVTAGPEAMPGARAAAPSLALVLLLAFAGGFILNGMPCVLPILSLKLFGLVKASGQSRAAVRVGALATTAGILFSFLALALAAVAARSAGAAIGWGIQFQQPGFVAFLAVVVLLFSLNLWGLFEIQLPARLLRAAESGTAERSGLAGHFATGLFATLMATPCSAPFLGTALSFALGQRAETIVATLLAVGAGLALPYLLLAVAPGAVRHLPRPGAWMDTLRGAMGFLLAGALVWLFYVLAAQVAVEELAFFQLALLALGLALFFAHRARAGSFGRRAGWLAAAAFAVGSILLVSGAPEAAARTAPAAGGGERIAWVPFDRAEAERLARSGRLVFLDVTADWCVTCKVNERLVLETPEIRGAFRDFDVVPMKADWTNRDDGIARFLAEHGRYGIPFYLLYRPGLPPHVFGELITKQGVLDVLAASAPAPAG